MSAGDCLSQSAKPTAPARGLTMAARPNQPRQAYHRMCPTPPTAGSAYLPLRTIAAFQGSHSQLSILVQDYRWLPPTTANLAALHAAIHHATIPSRFRKLPPADLPLAGFSTATASQP